MEYRWWQLANGVYLVCPFARSNFRVLFYSANSGPLADVKEIFSIWVDARTHVPRIPSSFCCCLVARYIFVPLLGAATRFVCVNIWWCRSALWFLSKMLANGKGLKENFLFEFLIGKTLRPKKRLSEFPNIAVLHFAKPEWAWTSHTRSHQNYPEFYDVEKFDIIRELFLDRDLSRTHKKILFHFSFAAKTIARNQTNRTSMLWRHSLLNILVLGFYRARAKLRLFVYSLAVLCTQRLLIYE